MLHFALSAAGYLVSDNAFHLRDYPNLNKHDWLVGPIWSARENFLALDKGDEQFQQVHRSSESNIKKARQAGLGSVCQSPYR